MDIGNVRLYQHWLRSKNRDWEIRYLSWAMKIASDAEDLIVNGIKPDVAYETARQQNEREERVMSDLMRENALNFLRQTWRYGEFLREGGKSHVRCEQSG